MTLYHVCEYDTNSFLVCIKLATCNFVYLYGESTCIVGKILANSCFAIAFIFMFIIFP